MRKPLDGVKVLELGNFVAAPFAGKIFGEFGAEVIKVEDPKSGRFFKELESDASRVLPYGGMYMQEIKNRLHLICVNKKVRKWFGS